MKFGIFDHMDRGALPLGAQYEERLKLCEVYDRTGFHSYHIAEHHMTPLGMAPSPSVFLAAVAQRTRTLRFGPLVYTLPLHHPLRVYEEICMLDHMSGGRLEVGLGRGAVPHEVAYYGVDPAEGQARYFEAYQVVLQALQRKSLTFEGKFYSFRDVPLELEPVQRPHPPLWYGVSNVEATAWAANNGLNVVCNGPPAMIRAMTDRYRADWAAAGKRDEEAPLMSMTRHLVLADSEAEALDVARRGYKVWHESFFKIWRRHGTLPANAVALLPDTFDELQNRGYGLAGTPAALRDALRAQFAAAGNNYLLCRFAFGDLSFAETMRSLDLFVRDVMPALGARREAAE